MLSPTYEITTALSHTDELISPPYDIAIVTISYGRVTMSSVWDSMMSKKNMGWPFYAAVPHGLATREINTLSWAHKEFVTRVHTFFSIYATLRSWFFFQVVETFEIAVAPASPIPTPSLCNVQNTTLLTDPYPHILQTIYFSKWKTQWNQIEKPPMKLLVKISSNKGHPRAIFY